jgi:hypothetical protein
MRTDVIVETPPNDAPAMDEVWVWVSRDKEGRENVCGSLIGSIGTQPLMTGNPRIFELMRPLAQELRAHAEATGRTIHLLRFSARQEIPEW